MIFVRGGVKAAIAPIVVRKACLSQFILFLSPLCEHERERSPDIEQSVVLLCMSRRSVD